MPARNMWCACKRMTEVIQNKGVESVMFYFVQLSGSPFITLLKGNKFIGRCLQKEKMAVQFGTVKFYMHSDCQVKPDPEMRLGTFLLKQNLKFESCLPA